MQSTEVFVNHQIGPNGSMLGYGSGRYQSGSHIIWQFGRYYSHSMNLKVATLI